MKDYTMFLPNYTVSADNYRYIPHVTHEFGKKAVVIGGKIAMSKTKEALLEAVKESELEIIDFIWYGNDCTYENIEKLMENPSVSEADMLFGVGDGRAVDTVKSLGKKIRKPYFAFPTLASNCAGTTAVCVVYNADGSFKEYDYLERPPYHTFINISVIADAPAKLLWAGIGDALSKECEVLFESRDKVMYHTPLMGRCVAKVCTALLVEYGKQALQDCHNKKASFELEQVALDIIVSTGMVSNFMTHENQPNPNEDYYYNSSLAHCLYYGASLLPECEKHLHGEIVAYGVLCLLTYDEQFGELEKIMEFNRSIGLPITLDEIGIKKSNLNMIAEKSSTVVKWKYIPGTPTKEKFIKAIMDNDEKGKVFKASERIEADD